MTLHTPELVENSIDITENSGIVMLTANTIGSLTRVVRITPARKSALAIRPGDILFLALSTVAPVVLSDGSLVQVQHTDPLGIQTMVRVETRLASLNASDSDRDLLFTFKQGFVVAEDENLDILINDPALAAVANTLLRLSTLQIAETLARPLGA